MSKLIFTKGVTDPVGDCGNFAAGIDVPGWGHRIECYGTTPADAEEMRDKVLALVNAGEQAEMFKALLVKLYGAGFNMLGSSGRRRALHALALESYLREIEQLAGESL